jgi:lipoyl(octanoyl) transferase
VVRWLGRTAYADGLALQERIVRARHEEAVPDTLLLLEHPPVITLGRGSDRAHLLASEAELAARGVEVHECGRGGDVTYHGPGQLVGYPVFALRGRGRDAHRYLRDLEQALIRCAADFGVDASRLPGLTGVWVGERKLAAIGVRLSSGWITSHGFALNVTTDLRGYDAIVPCGIRDRGVTSLAELLVEPPSLLEAAGRAASRIAEVFAARIVDSDLDIPPGGAA